MSNAAVGRALYRELMRNARLFDKQPLYKAFLQRPYASVYRVTKRAAIKNDQTVYQLLEGEKGVNQTPLLLWRVFDRLLGEGAEYYNPQIQPTTEFAQVLREWARGDVSKRDLVKEVDAGLMLLRSLEAVKRNAREGCAPEELAKTRRSLDWKAQAAADDAAAAESKRISVALSALKVGAILVAHPLKFHSSPFNRSMVLIQEHSSKRGTKGIILNRPLPGVGFACIGTPMAEPFRTSASTPARVYHDSLFYGGPIGRHVTCVYNSHLANLARSEWARQPAVLPSSSSDEGRASATPAAASSLATTCPSAAESTRLDGTEIAEQVFYMDSRNYAYDPRIQYGEGLQVVCADMASSVKQQLNLVSANAKLDADKAAKMRFFLGRAEWCEGQLEEEIAAGNWIVIDAGEHTADVALQPLPSSATAEDGSSSASTMAASASNSDDDNNNTPSSSSSSKDRGRRASLDVRDTFWRRTLRMLGGDFALLGNVRTPSR